MAYLMVPAAAHINFLQQKITNISNFKVWGGDGRDGRGEKGRERRENGSRGRNGKGKESRGHAKKKDLYVLMCSIYKCLVKPLIKNSHVSWLSQSQSVREIWHIIRAP